MFSTTSRKCCSVGLKKRFDLNRKTMITTRSNYGTRHDWEVSSVCLMNPRIRVESRRGVDEKLGCIVNRWMVVFCASCAGDGQKQPTGPVIAKLDLLPSSPRQQSDLILDFLTYTRLCMDPTFRTIRFMTSLQN